MRDGTLLAEESPNQLLIKHNCSTLEQAFLELSKRQTRSSIMDREDENCVCLNYTEMCKHYINNNWTQYC